jgi:hypothetical protein
MVGVLWSAGGWTAVTVAGVALSAVGLAIWAAGRRGPLAVPARRTAAEPTETASDTARWTRGGRRAREQDLDLPSVTPGTASWPGALFDT